MIQKKIVPFGSELEQRLEHKLILGWRFEAEWKICNVKNIFYEINCIKSNNLDS